MLFMAVTSGSPKNSALLTTSDAGNPICLDIRPSSFLLFDGSLICK